MSTQVTTLTAKRLEKAQQAALDILGSFYSCARAWTANEIITAKRLEARGWIPARAAYISTWLEEARDGAPWRHFTSQRDGICAVEKALETIEARCGAEQAAPRNKMPPDPAYDEHWKKTTAGLDREGKIAAAQAPFRVLWAEAEAAGLKGHAAAEYVRIERGRRMKGRHLPGQPITQRCDGSPTFGLPVDAMGGTFPELRNLLTQQEVPLRTDETPPIEVEFVVEDDAPAEDYPDVSE